MWALYLAAAFVIGLPLGIVALGLVEVAVELREKGLSGALKAYRRAQRKQEAKYDAQGWHPCPCPIGRCGVCDNGRIWRN